MSAAASSEDSSTPTDVDHHRHSDSPELELGLGLSGFYVKKSPYTRILTARDLPSSTISSSSSSSSSSSCLSSSNSTTTSLGRVGFGNSSSVGSKRTASASLSPPTTTTASSSQVVGWPPIRAYRINSMTNQAKTLAVEELKGNNAPVEKAGNESNMDSKAKIKRSLFVKVNMDGIPIGRKIDLSAQGCYGTLSKTLEDMFLRPLSGMGVTRLSNLLDGSSGFVLTYEDKEGDWMLVGDVPWGMFLSSVKRLKIMRTSEATGLAPMMR